MADETITKADIDKAVKDALDAARESFDAEVAGLKDKNKELLGKLRAAGEIKPEDMAAVEAERDKALADLAAAQKQAKEATAAADKATKALEAETGFTSKLLVQDGIKSALIAHGVKDDDYLDALTTKFATGASVVADGEQRKAIIGDKAIADVIKEWAASDAGKKFVAAPVNGGGGAPGGTTAGGTGKTISRTDYEAAMKSQDVGQIAAVKAQISGGAKIVDAAA